MMNILNLEDFDMALKDQPYLPLYVKDFLTDEKLIECSANATGIYIRIMCIMHKSDEYGTILLRQKDRQSDQQILNFATKLAKQLPYKFEEIISGLQELVDERVLYIKEDRLLQKRMVRDNELSVKRSEAGKKGAFAANFAEAKPPANTVIEDDDESVFVFNEKGETKIENLQKEILTSNLQKQPGFENLSDDQKEKFKKLISREFSFLPIDEEIIQTGMIKFWNKEEYEKHKQTSKSTEDVFYYSPNDAAFYSLLDSIIFLWNDEMFFKQASKTTKLKTKGDILNWLKFYANHFFKRNFNIGIKQMRTHIDSCWDSYPGKKFREEQQAAFLRKQQGR